MGEWNIFIALALINILNALLAIFAFTLLLGKLSTFKSKVAEFN